MSSRAPEHERGSTHLLLILGIIVVALIIGAGWLVYTKTVSKKSPAGSTSSTQNSALASAAQSACNAKFHDSDLCQFVAATAAQPFDKTSAVITMTTTTDGQPATLVLAQDGKGNNQLTTNGGGTSVESITLNGVLYTKVAGQAVWTKYPSMASAPTETTPSSDLSFLSSLNNEQFTKIGTAACDGANCLKYQFTDNLNPGATQYVLIDTSNHLMREYTSTGGTFGSLDMKVAYQNVTISMPSPVQDLSASVGQ